MISLLNCDARQIPLADKSVHAIITSPPYWGLRDYATGRWIGGDPDCDHRPGRASRAARSTLEGGKATQGHRQEGYHEYCPNCGAYRIDKQIGLERLHDCLAWARGEEPCGICYVCTMRIIAQEFWRVLRDDGTLWLNLGDSYYNGNKGGRWDLGRRQAIRDNDKQYDYHKQPNRLPVPTLKPKDMVGIPWRVALALQADGWTLRSDIIWSKPNAMPESVRDRPVKAHEYILLFTKRRTYYFDHIAIQTPVKESSLKRIHQRSFFEQFGGEKDYERSKTNPNRSMRKALENFAVSGHGGANRRSVWHIATQPYAGAHFATWPPALVELMIKAATSAHGVCPHCGAPWKRIITKPETERATTRRNDDGSYPHGKSTAMSLSEKRQAYRELGLEGPPPAHTVGWEPSCSCPDHAPSPAIVLDPFVGSGTTLQVARALSRSAIGLDLNPQYLNLARSRLELDKIKRWQR